MPDNLLAERLGRMIALTPDENALLAGLEERERRVRRGAVLLSENDASTEIFVLRQGMMMSYVLLDDGSRQILRFLLPGDLLATSTLCCPSAPETIMAITDSVVSPFERQALVDLFAAVPRLALAIMAIEQMERIVITDRLAAIGRTSAKARVAGLLLEMRDRLRKVDPAVDNSFVPGITQEEIGDITGLTAVHVNRMLRQLEDEGMIVRGAGRVTLLNEAQLARAANYVDRYARLDLSWLPAAD